MFSEMFFLYKVHSSVSGVNPSLVRDGSSLSECVWLHHNAAAIKLQHQCVTHPEAHHTRQDKLFGATIFIK